MKKQLLALPLLLLYFLAGGQSREASHWYFGYHCGIDFSSGSPVVDTAGQLESIEGASAISDQQGRLLFYSNGEKVWAANHTLMPNGTGLFGNQSAAQSSLIVPAPGNSSLYYLFTTDASVHGACYSTIDMTANNGLGDVTTTRNILLFNAASEALAGTLHCNGNDYWIVSRQHRPDTLMFFVYRLSAAGLSSPRTMAFGFKCPDPVGSLTFSQDGKTLCFSGFGAAIYLFHFNYATGMISFRDSIPAKPNELIYGNALSPDGRKLYITSWTARDYCRLSQFDLSAPSAGAARTNLDSIAFANGSPNGYGFIGQLRLAPDQRIYISRWKQNNPRITNPDTYYALDSLDVIQSPNSTGPACGFRRNFLYLNHRPTEIGLPGFISTFTLPGLPLLDCLTEDVPHTSVVSEVTLFPNPCTTSATLRSGQPFRDAALQVYDAVGRQVSRLTGINGYSCTLQTGHLGSGTYFIRLARQDGDVRTFRLVVLNHE